ncbi:MAG: hypothetical protein Barrevirus3_23 [Barrevirus sp.]|uniref:Uncharacterized protein n=1 Tax=Barrevirus sp. TaxID=2487763 RepID=A0A3G4ZTH0_9VIRU|nr:MAG: hypothetical protein Barrevirus3_23 [Barrevirus sp.]
MDHPDDSIKEIKGVKLATNIADFDPAEFPSLKHVVESYKPPKSSELLDLMFVDDTIIKKVNDDSKTSIPIMTKYEYSDAPNPQKGEGKVLKPLSGSQLMDITFDTNDMVTKTMDNHSSTFVPLTKKKYVSTVFPKKKEENKDNSANSDSVDDELSAPSISEKEQEQEQELEQEAEPEKTQEDLMAKDLIEKDIEEFAIEQQKKSAIELMYGITYDTYKQKYKNYGSKLKQCSFCLKFFLNEKNSFITKTLVVDKEEEPAEGGEYTCYHCLYWINYNSDLRSTVDGLYEKTIHDYILECAPTHDQNTCLHAGECFICDYLNGKRIVGIFGEEELLAEKTEGGGEGDIENMRFLITI